MAPDGLSPRERADARLIFSGKDPEGRLPCVHCAGIHERVATLELWRQPCARVKCAKWHVDGVSLLEVEYWGAGWDEGLDIIRPADAFEEDEEDAE